MSFHGSDLKFQLGNKRYNHQHCALGTFLLLVPQEVKKLWQQAVTE